MLEAPEAVSNTFWTPHKQMKDAQYYISNLFHKKSQILKAFQKFNLYIKIPPKSIIFDCGASLQNITKPQKMAELKPSLSHR